MFHIYSGYMLLSKIYYYIIKTIYYLILSNFLLILLINSNFNFNIIFTQKKI